MPVTAEELHSLALQAIDDGRRAAARRLVLRARALDPVGPVRARILITAAYFEAESRSVAAGLAMLEEAEAADLPEELRGLLLAQRGGLLMRAGDPGAAAVLRRSLLLLPAGLRRDRALVHLNLGVLQAQHGHPARALRDFKVSAELSASAGADTLAAQAMHNIGWTRLGTGDLVGALQAMDAAAPTLTSLSAAAAAVCYADRAQVLLAAGLLEEAAGDLDRAARTFGTLRSRQDQAEAELTLARVHLARGRAPDARTAALRAAARFRRRGAVTWEQSARLVVIEADIKAGHRLRTARTGAESIAVSFQQQGLPVEARRARLVATEAALATDPQAACAVVGDSTRLRRADPLGVRLHSRRVRSALAAASGDTSRAQAELRAAVLEIQRHQATLGSLDLQTAAGSHVASITSVGLGRALRSGSAQAVFSWAELGRGLSSRLSPLTPPDDPVLAELLQGLREARSAVQQTVSGAEGASRRARVVDLQRQVQEHTWGRGGRSRTWRPRALREVRAACAETNGVLVAHLDVAGRLVGLVVDAEGAELHELGSTDAVREAASRLHADLDVLASAALPTAVRAQVARSMARTVSELDSRLCALPRLRGAGPVLLTPSTSLPPLPWTMLPSLHGRPVTLAATATAWLAARAPFRPTRVGFVAGPDLEHAGEEVERASSCWRAPQVQLNATCAQALDLATRVDVLHVAAHGVHEPESPLFSHLRLADGPLFGHELYELPRSPAHVVLSACGLGRSVSRAGDESLGMTAALLAGGVQSVVAGTARISDPVAAQVGARYHHALRSGCAPSAALATVLAERSPDLRDPGSAPVPLVCFGAGW